MNAPALSKHLMDRAERERKILSDGITRLCKSLLANGKFTGDPDAAIPYTDAQVAPIYAEKLRHVYAKLVEVWYPELEAANGEVLPIDSSMPPGAETWEYDMIDSGASMDWIDDEGQIAPNAFVKSAGKFVGRTAEFGGGYKTNLFDDERQSMAGMNLSPIKGAAVKRAHDVFCEWRWLFGSPDKDGMLGLCTHPNMPMSMAANNAGDTSKLPENKTNAEILADFISLIDGVAEQSLERFHAVTVYMPHSLIRLMRTRFLDATAEGKQTLWDRLKGLYSGDDSGQGKVTFKGANFCSASRRKDPRTGTDTSGISGDFLLALPPQNADELCFIRARPFTMRPPEEKGFSVQHLAHGKIGGCKMVQPLSCAMLIYGTT